MSYTLRDGHPVTTDRGPAPLPIEGARAVAEGLDVLVLIGYRAPTGRERRAVASAPVSLAVLTRGPVALLLLQFGNPTDPGYVSCTAPFSALDPDADPAPFLAAESQGVAVHVALCDGESGRVRAVRSLHAPVEFASRLRVAGSIQRAAFRSDAGVQAESLCATRGKTFQSLLSSADLRTCL